MLAPNATKNPPVFSLTQLASLCGIDKGQVTYRISKGDLPAGHMNEKGSRREFSLEAARAWVQHYRAAHLRPDGARAVTIAVGNFKGGVSKTTTAMVLAQGLSLRGHKVLAIDADPQGSLTTLFGIMPDTEVTEEQTIAPLVYGETTSIRSAIQETYWQGVDLVAASSSLFSAEFVLPSRQMKDPAFQFWDVLNLGLEDVRDDYDCIRNRTAWTGSGAATRKTLSKHWPHSRTTMSRWAAALRCAASKKSLTHKGSLPRASPVFRV